MKPVTIVVDESTYKAFQDHGRRVKRSTSDLIREAMEEYRRTRIGAGRSLEEWRPASVGRVIRPLRADDDLLEEMGGWRRDDRRG